MATRRSTVIEPGRTYDIDFINWIDDVEGEAQFTFGTLSKKTTGLVKAVNKFLKILLTHKGSDPFDTNLGTYFDEMPTLGGYDTTELGTFASEQLSDALDQIRTIQANNNFLADENIASVTLTDISRPTTDKAIFYVRILSEAGEGITVKVPMIGG